MSARRRRATSEPGGDLEGIGPGRVPDLLVRSLPVSVGTVQGKLTPKARTSFRWVPNGIPGVETRLPILLLRRRSRGPHQPQRIRRALTSTNHAKMYGLYPKKGIDRSPASTPTSSSGTRTEGDDPPGTPAPRLRLHALRGVRGDGLADHDHTARQDRNGGRKNSGAPGDGAFLKRDLSPYAQSRRSA